MFPLRPTSYPRLLRGAAVFVAWAGFSIASSALQAQQLWNFNDQTADPYSASAIDMRVLLNEEIAGQSGWVTHANGRFYRGDGEPIRFWGATVGALATTALIDEQAKFLAKRGLNLVRWHTSIYNNSGPTMDSVRMGPVDDVHRMVSSFKKQGIYTKLSYFFILGLRIRPEWEIDGYTSEWLQANRSYAEAAPFGLQFFDPKFKAAMKRWMEVLLTTPNPYEPDNRPLKDDPAVPIFEVQNEDNLFFHTWNPARFPVVQQERMFKQFGDWLIARYGSIAAAQTAWGGAALQGDNPAAGRMALGAAFYMGSPTAGNRRRVADQVIFFLEVQRDFMAEMAAHVRDLGYGGTVLASNWKTANDNALMDGEHYTYTGAGVVGSNNYFGPYARTNPNNDSVWGKGSVYADVPVVKNPRRNPATYKKQHGFPVVVTENTWVNPSTVKAEAPLVIAAYSALTDINGWNWFAIGEPRWAPAAEGRNWQVSVPDMMGQFPAAALIYRRGYIAEAPVVVFEQRSLRSIANVENSLLSQSMGWSLTTNPATTFNYDPDTGVGRLDTLAMLVGRTSIRVHEVDSGSTDDLEVDYVAPEVLSLIDNTARTVTSVTGELRLDHDKGLLVLNAPRAQGATGHLNSVTRINTQNLIIRSQNDFGAVVAVPLDGRPINQSERILVQSMTRATLTGWATTPQRISGLDGQRVDNVGVLPWQVINTNATVTLVGLGQVVSAQALNENGYAQGAPLGVTATPDGPRITLPSNAMYTLITVTPPADAPPAVMTRGLEIGLLDEPYLSHLEAAGGSGGYSWSLAEGSTLPDGLSLSPEGSISGTPTEGGRRELTFVVTDSASRTGEQTLVITVLPLVDEEPPPVCASVMSSVWTVDFGSGFKYNGMGFVYDAFSPFYYVYGDANWIYVFGCGDTVDESEGYYLYDFKRAQFGFTYAELYPYYVAVGGANDSQAFDLSGGQP